jgi:hypothetical protein
LPWCLSGHSTGIVADQAGMRCRRYGMVGLSEYLEHKTVTRKH